MAKLYISQAHGLPDLDLELLITDNTVTANIYSANEYGGTFGYPEGIDYTISAGGTGFTINTGQFSYSGLGELITSKTGNIGTGDLTVYCTCNGGGDACYGETEVNQPYYNASKSSDINVSALTVHGEVAVAHHSKLMNSTLLLTYTGGSGISVSLTGKFIESKFNISVLPVDTEITNLKITAISNHGNPDLVMNHNSLVSSFTDFEIIDIYEMDADYLQVDNEISFKVDVTSSTGATATTTGTMLVGGTMFMNLTDGGWHRCVPIQITQDEFKACLSFINVNDIWRRNNPEV